MPALAGTVTDFAMASDVQGVLQRVMGLALVETDLSAALLSASSSHSTMESVLSTRPISRKATAN